MPSILDRRQSKGSLFDLFSRPKVERSRGYHETGLNTVMEVPHDSDSEDSDDGRDVAEVTEIIPSIRGPSNDLPAKFRRPLLRERKSSDALSHTSKTASSIHSSTKRHITNLLSVRTAGSSPSLSSASSTWSRSPNLSPSNAFQRLTSFASSGSPGAGSTSLRLGSTALFTPTQWEPPTLTQAFAMSTKHGTVLTSVYSADTLIRHQSQGNALDSHSISSPTTDPSPDMAHASGFARRSNSRRISSAFGNVGLDLTRLENKVFALMNTGYVLQYPDSGPDDRRPDRVLRLGPESAAFASDLIPGRHYVLHICEKMTIDDKDLTPAFGVGGDEGVRGLFKRLGGRSQIHRRTVGNMLLVLESPEEMGEWMHIVRRTIDTMAGRGADFLNLDPSTTSLSATPSFDQLKENAGTHYDVTGSVSDPADRTSSVATASTSSTASESIRRTSILAESRPTVQVQVTPPLSSPPSGNAFSPSSGKHGDDSDSAIVAVGSPPKGRVSSHFGLSHPSPHSAVTMTDSVSPNPFGNAFLQRSGSATLTITTNSSLDLSPEQRTGGSGFHLSHQQQAAETKSNLSSHESGSISLLSNGDDPAETILAATTLAGMSRKRRSLILADPGPSPSYTPELPPRRDAIARGSRPRLAVLQLPLNQSGSRRHSAVPDAYRGLPAPSADPESTDGIRVPPSLKTSRSATQLTTLGETSESKLSPVRSVSPAPLPVNLRPQVAIAGTGDRFSGSRSLSYDHTMREFHNSSPLNVRSATNIRRPASVQINSDSTSFPIPRRNPVSRSSSGQAHSTLDSLSEEHPVNPAGFKQTGTIPSLRSAHSVPARSMSASASMKSGHVPFLMDSTRSRFVVGSDGNAPRSLRLPVIPTATSPAFGSHSTSNSPALSTSTLASASPSVMPEIQQANVSQRSTSPSAAGAVAAPVPKVKRSSSSLTTPTSSNTSSTFFAHHVSPPGSISIFPSQRIRVPSIPIPGGPPPVHGSSAMPRAMAMGLGLGAHKQGSMAGLGLSHPAQLPSPPSSTTSPKRAPIVAVSNN